MRPPYRGVGRAMTDGLGAMVLASGEGRRLRPLTADVPKPMLPVLGQTLLDRALDKVAATGPHRIVVALHHRPDVVADHLRSGRYPVSVKVEERLTGPGRRGAFLWRRPGPEGAAGRLR